MTGHGYGVSAPAGFVLREVIGRGASSTVWAATQQSTGRSVALKLLAVDLHDAEYRRRFERERQAMATLSSHPHIVTLFDAGVHEDRPWLALALQSGRSYAARLIERGPLPPAAPGPRAAPGEGTSSPATAASTARRSRRRSRAGRSG